MDNRRSIFARPIPFLPVIVDKEGLPFLLIGAGADVNHEPRTFSIALSASHVEVIKGSLQRHMLLWRALLILCRAAGMNDELNVEAATITLSIVLSGDAESIDDLFKTIPWNDLSLLLDYGANASLLENGHIFAATQSLNETADSNISLQYQAIKERRERGIVLSELDIALLKYTSQFTYRGSIPLRRPQDVPPHLLADVERIVAIAQDAADSLTLPPNWAKSDDVTLRKEARTTLEASIQKALRDSPVQISTDTVEAISFLVSYEAAR